MKLKFMKLREVIAVVAVVSVGALLTTTGCSNDHKTVDTDSAAVGPDTSSIVVPIGGEIFSIPSPIQTALLIKSSGVSYNKNLMNPASKITQYSTNFAKAINLGIYGADLGYVTIYDQSQDASGYLVAAKKLSDGLGISAAFDTKTIERFNKNLGNKDSMLSLVGVAYRASDAYLKTNDRSDVSGLVLAGGWIESLYFTTDIYKAKPNDEIKRRIAEQKLSLQNLIKLLKPYYSQSEYTKFIDGLTDLSTVYDGVEFKYTYVKPTTDAAKKLTTINSTTEVTISAEQIDAITQKVKAIRAQIVG
jgi:hypothetical protein